MTAALPEAQPDDSRRARDVSSRSSLVPAAGQLTAVPSRVADPPGAPAIYDALLARLADGSAAPAERASLVDEAARVWSRPGFDTFLSAASLRFEPFDYQLKAAQTVLRRMRGRAILADEVGLGKTIEAGLVLSELRLRALAGRSLVITPAGLVQQWREELERKFGLPTVIAGSSGWPAERRDAIVIASIAAARRDPLKSHLAAAPWDVVILDEAHRVRSSRSASGRLARALRARYLLLLTATPVENRLQDLYELVTLVSPGLLGTPAQFRARHGGSSETGPPRDDEDAGLYADLTGRIRAAAAGAKPSMLMTLRALARLAGSSPAAAAPTLTKIGWDDLAGRAARLGRTAKLAAGIR